MNSYKNKREVSEAYVEAAINLDIPLVKHLLTSNRLVYKADINFDEAVFNNLCIKDKTAELTKYLFTSPDLAEHLKFSYPGFRSAIINDNVCVTQFLLQKFNKKYNLDDYLTGDWGINEMDSFSKKMINCLYFEYAQPGTKKFLLEKIILTNDLDGIQQILEGDCEINKKQVLNAISHLGIYDTFKLFDDITHYSHHKKNIPDIVHASCNKRMEIKLIKSIIQNDEWTGYYDMNSRVFKKVMNSPELLRILIMDRNAQLTPSIAKVCSEKAKQMFAARDFKERLDSDLTEKSKTMARKI